MTVFLPGIYFVLSLNLIVLVCWELYTWKLSGKKQYPQKPDIQINEYAFILSHSVMSSSLDPHGL